VTEIEAALDGARRGFVDFEDENISLDRKWFHEVLVEVAKRFGERDIELRAMNGLYPPSLDDKTIVLMKRAGFKTLNLSVGSMSPERLKKFNRPDVTACLDRVIANAAKQGLESVCYIIAAAPGQTAEESLSDLIQLASRPVLLGLSIFYPAPGSLDFTRLERQGLLPAHFSMMRSSALPCPEGISRVEAATLLRLSRIVNFMKGLSRGGMRIPGTTVPSEEKIPRGLDRVEIGRKLVSRFLFDGRIRGVKHDGEIYEHEVSMELTRRFLKRFH
jgi:hypothetical protein